MELINTILELVKNQKKNVNEIEKSLRELNSHDYLHENAELKNENERLENGIKDLQKKHEILADQNNSLRLALKEQIIDERTNILKVSVNKMNIYFGKSKNSADNNLTSSENEMRLKIRKLEETVNSSLSHRKKELLDELQNLKLKYAEAFMEQKKLVEEEYKRQLASNDEKYRKISDEELSGEALQKRIRQNKLELKIGLSLLNKISIFLFLMGTGVLARYSYAKWFNDYMKGSVFFGMGILFLAAGEFFYRKNKDVFSKGLLGGGIGILYGALFYSYMLLHILGLQTALVLSVAVTVCAVLLSLRYNSETIGGASLVGGYLPFFTYTANYDLNESSVYMAAAYVVILNVFLLLISVKKRWRIILPLSYILFAPTLSILSFSMERFHVQLMFVSLLFILYTAAILVYPLFYRMRLRIVDIIILGINIVVNCSIVFSIFRAHKIENADGLIALVFALVSFLIGNLIMKFINQEKTASVIFFVTALTFAVLMIPFQFGIKWASMGWLVEGTVLIAAGYRSRQQYIEYAGWLVFVLCSIMFFIYDFTGYYGYYYHVNDDFFAFKFLFIVLGSITAAFFYSIDIYNKKLSIFQLRGKVGLALKYYSAFILWIFFIVISDYLLDKYQSSDPGKYLERVYFLEFYKVVIVAVFSAVLAYCYRKIRIISDRVMQIFSVVLYVVAVMSVIAASSGYRVFSDSFSPSPGFRVLSFTVLVAVNLISFAIVRDVVLTSIQSSGKSLEIYPPAVTVYFLMQLTVLIVRQSDFSYENLMISFSYLVVALFSIAFGFVKKYVNIRLFGLGLTVFSLAKLFIWDLRTLQTSGKILAYFGFGAIILLISFIYQKVKNIVDVPDVEK